MHLINWKSLPLILLWCIHEFTASAQAARVDTTSVKNAHWIKTSHRNHKKPHGICVYYYATGQMMRKEKWKDGKLRWQIKYDLYNRKIYGVNSKLDTSFYKACNCPN